MIARTRVRPGTVPAPAPALPSNVVELRPGIRIPAAPEAPPKARSRTSPKVTKTPDFLRKVTKETGKNTQENNDLLRGPGLTQVRGQAILSPSRENTIPSAADPTFQRLVAKLPATKLRETFPLEANSHRNMMGRAKDGGYIVDPAFHDFRAFLAHVGPRPSEAWTLDRKDPRNPVYGPGLVRWADKRQQANNRADTVMLTMDGFTRPLAEWARMTGQERRTLAKRIDRGWSHAEAIRGRRLEDEPLAPPAPQPAPPSALPASVDGRWPTGATPSYWEAHWQAFAARYHKRYRVEISRHVLFAWIVSNKIHVINESLAQKYPGHMDPNCAEDAPDVSRDPDYQLIEKFTLPWGEALCAIDDVKGEHGLFLGLKTRWRFVVNPEQLAAIKFDRPEDPIW